MSNFHPYKYDSNKYTRFVSAFKLSNMDSYFYGAITSIVVLHIVLVMFVYVAWTEGSKKKDD